MARWTVLGHAHGTKILEHGFTSIERAQAYASERLDGDVDGWVELFRDDDQIVGTDRLCRHCDQPARDHCPECDACPDQHAGWCSEDGR